MERLKTFLFKKKRLMDFNVFVLFLNFIYTWINYLFNY